MKFIHHYPSRVKRLFLIDNAGVYITDTYWELFINAFLSNVTYFSKHPIQLLKFVIKIFSKPIWHRRQAYFGKNIDLQREASQIKTPTIIFWGEKDKLIPLWHGQKLHQLIPNSNLVVLKDKKHDWILNNPELFWQSI